MRKDKLIFVGLMLLLTCVGNYIVWLYVGWYNYILLSLLCGLIFNLIAIRIQRKQRAYAQAYVELITNATNEELAAIYRLGI
jgi:hypothetical protein